MPQSIHTSCPRCRRPFVIVWDRDAAPRERTSINCPHVIDGAPCPGSVEAVLPADAHAVVQVQNSPR